MNTQSKNPTLKLVYNLPVQVVFETLQPKEIHSEQYNTTSFLYYVIIDGRRHAFFATERQNEILQNFGLELGTEYTLLRSKQSDDKYEDFKIAGASKHNETFKEASTQTEHQASLDQLLPPMETKVSTKEHKYSNHKPNVLPEAAAWAIKTAIQSLGPTQSFDTKYENEILVRAQELLRIQQKIV